MEFIEFAQYIESASILYLPEKYQKAYSLKLAQGRTGAGDILRFEDNQEHLAEMPGIDVQSLYQRQDDKTALQEAIRDYILAYEKTLDEEERLKESLNALSISFPKERVFFTLLPAGRYERFKHLEKCPVKVKDDVVFLYSLYLGEENGILKTCRIDNELMDKWGMDSAALHKAAVQCMPGLFPYEVREIKSFNQPIAYAISSQFHMYGLSSIFYPDGPLKEIASEQKSDLYVMSLSVHEGIVVPKGRWISEDKLHAMLKPYNIFSHNIYYYDWKTGELAMNEAERAELLARKKNGILDAADKNMFRPVSR